MAQSVLIRVSRENAQELERIKRVVNVRSVDAAIAFLLRKSRTVALKRMLGRDPGMLKSFVRRDRWEDRD